MNKGIQVVKQFILIKSVENWIALNADNPSCLCTRRVCLPSFVNIYRFCDVSYTS